MDPAFQWDLSTLYTDDEAWERDLPLLDQEIEEVAAFQGTLMDAKTIRAYLDAETGMERRLSNIYTYAMLRQAEDTTANEGQVLMSKATGRYVNAVSKTSFARPEMLALPEEELKKITESEELVPYRFTMQQLLDEKPHVLSGKEEELLAGFSEVLGAPKRIAENLMDADLTFARAKDQDGREHELNEANFILLQQSPDRTLRENVFHNYYAGFRNHINTFAAAYSGVVKAAAAEAKARHYESSRAMAMAGEHIPASVYDGLVDTVRRFLPAMYRYVALRKKILGLSELHYYDVYVPLSRGSRGHWSYEEAQEMVLRAVAPLGTTYTSKVRDAFQSRWIDVYPNEGKRGGAFSSGTYDSNPYILTSFAGDYDSVSTIAHEMGHSMHTWFSQQHQPPQYGDYTLFVAEVASTVNENLLVEDLLRQTTDPAERLFLLNQYLEGFKGTVFRQTMFAEFERDAHRMAEAGEALTPDALSGLYRKLIADYFGPELSIDDEVQYEWARIPHFYRPFYVYKYATSYSAAVALSDGILEKGESVVQPYLSFLSMGGSAYPLDELRSAGIDLATTAPIENALEKFERILDDAEETVRTL